MNLLETTLSSQVVYKGKILTLKKDQVRLPNGGTSTREVVVHNGAVCIAPIDKEGNVILVRQYRYALSQELLELPAGKIDPGEDFHAAAVRELEEETGCTAGELRYLGTFFPSVGYLTEVIHLFVATGLTQKEQRLDPDEFLKVVKLPLAQAVKQVLAGELPDGKTQALLLRADALFQAGELHLQ